MTITCFTGSYMLALAAEIGRFVFRDRVRPWLGLLLGSVGLLAHTLYLWQEASTALANGDPLFSSWQDWCLLASWILAASYLGLMIRHAENAVGLFLLPLVLGLIGIAIAVRDGGRFSRDEALGIWRLVHGFALMAGTVSVILGFGAGVMYLTQSYRLKHKFPSRQGFRLPSLEWLQRFNRRTLWISTALLALGLLSGIALNAAKQQPSIAWTDPVILSSGVLFLWLLAVCLFEWLYVPSRQGRKVVYLTLASFIFLSLALGFVLYGEHASSSKAVSKAVTQAWTRGDTRGLAARSEP